jgi:hypothetical protein
MQSHAGYAPLATWAGNRGAGLSQSVSTCHMANPLAAGNLAKPRAARAALASPGLSCTGTFGAQCNRMPVRGAGPEWRQWFRSRDGLATGGPAGCGGVSQSVATCHLANALAAGNLASHSLAVTARPYRRTQTATRRAAIRSAGEGRRRRRGCRGEPGLRRCGRAFRRRRWSPSSWPPGPGASALSQSARPGRRLR